MLYDEISAKNSLSDSLPEGSEMLEKVKGLIHEIEK